MLVHIYRTEDKVDDLHDDLAALDRYNTVAFAVHEGMIHLRDQQLMAKSAEVKAKAAENKQLAAQLTEQLDNVKQLTAQLKHAEFMAKSLRTRAHSYKAMLSKEQLQQLRLQQLERLNQDLQRELSVPCVESPLSSASCAAAASTASSTALSSTTSPAASTDASASTTAPFPSSSTSAAGAAATTTSPAYNPLTAAPASASSSSAAPISLDGPLGFVLAYTDMRDYKWMLSLLLQECSTLGQPSARRQPYNPLAAAAASPATATSSTAAPIRFTGAQGLIMEHADKREYEQLLSLLLLDSDAAPSSTPTTSMTTASTTAFSSPASSSPAFSSPASSSHTSSPASASPASSTTAGPLFPVKATTTSCHVPAPYVPLAYRMLAAATKGASPYKLPYICSTAPHLSVSVRA